MAPTADPKLVKFLFLLLRDTLPAGYVESTMARALMRGPEPMGANPELAVYAERVARTLTYDRSQTPVQPDARPGTIAGSTPT